MIRRLAWLLCGLVLALSALIVYLSVADLGRFKNQLTPLLSKSLGRELRIDGALSLHLGRTVSLRAEDVSIANPAWATGAHLVYAAGLEAEVDLRSLIRGPVEVESLVLQGATIRLQKRADGRGNWSRPGDDTAGSDGAVRQALPNIDAFSATDVRVVLDAPNLSDVSKILLDTVDYAADDDDVNANASGEINGHPMVLRTRVAPAENSPVAGALRVDADVRLGEVNLVADILLQDAKTLAVAAAELELNGPDIDYVFNILKLPKITSGPLAITASLQPDPQRSGFDAEGRVGEYRFAVNGWLEDIRGARGFDLSMRLAGPSLAALGRPLGIDRLPSLPFDVDSGVRSRTDGIEFDDTRVIVGEASARGRGGVVWLPDGGQALDIQADYRGMSSTLLAKIPASWPAGELDFDIGVEGKDATEPARYLGLAHLDGQPFVLTADGTYGGGTVSLREASVAVGKQTLELSGRAGLDADAPDVDLRFDAERIDLSPWLADSDVLHDGLHTVAGTGRLKLSRGTLNADELALRSSDVALGGRVSLPLADRGRKGEFALKLTAPEVDRLLPGLALDAWEGQPVVVSASGSYRGRAVLLRESRVGLGAQEIELAGRAELDPDTPDIDVRFDAERLDLSPWLAGFDGIGAGLGTVAGTGRFKLSRGNLHADELALRSNDVALGGRLSLPLAERGRAGEFALHLTAPAVARLVRGLAGGAMDKQSLDLQADGGWKPGGWQVDEFLWRIPERGDLHGSVSFTNSETPSMQVRLNSESLDLRPAVKGATTPPAAAKRDRVIPDWKIAAPRFPGLDIDLKVDIDSLQSAVTAGAAFLMEARLANNQLIVDRLQTKGKRGQISAALTVDADPAAALEARLELTGQGLYIAAPDEPAEVLPARPRFDLEATLQARGADTRELAATLNGRLQIQAEAGTITRRGGVLVTLVMDDFLSRTLETINPLIKERDEVRLNCFVVLADIQNGKVQGAPLVALQTTEVNMLTRGEIDLASEALKLDIITKPRRGFGISLGDIINPFTRIGGTLAAPRLVADPQSAVFETGAGILTGGAWPLARKFRDRFFAGNPCAKALERNAEANQR